jgi:hypothetical protein
MRTKKNIQDYLKKLREDMASDEELENSDEKLPCCDYARLEESICMLEWVLD